MFRFDNFCERWAMSYKPLSHVISDDERGKRFFRHDSQEEMMDIAKALTNVNGHNRLMSVITAFDGDLARSSDQAARPNFYVWRRHVLFWVRQAQGRNAGPINEVAAADAKAEAMEMACDFITFLDYMSDSRRGNVKDLSGIDLDSIELSTLPVRYNGWWIAVLHFDQQEARELCNIETNYDLSLFASMFPTIPLEKIFKGYTPQSPADPEEQPVTP